MRRLIHRLAKNTYLSLAAGLVLLGTSGYEIAATLEEPSIGAHHGVFVYALFQLIKILPEMVEGVHGLHEGLDGAEG